MNVAVYLVAVFYALFWALVSTTYGVVTAYSGRRDGFRGAGWRRRVG